MTLTREDTGDLHIARQISRELVRADGWVPQTPQWLHPVHDGIDGLVPDRRDGRRMDYCRSLVGHDHAMHRWAQERDLAHWCAATAAALLPAWQQYRLATAEQLPAYRQWLALRDHPERAVEDGENWHAGLAWLSERRGWLHSEEDRRAQAEETVIVPLKPRPWWRRPFAAAVDALERAETRRQERMYG